MLICFFLLKDKILDFCPINRIIKLFQRLFDNIKNYFKQNDDYIDNDIKSLIYHLFFTKLYN